MSNQTIEDTSPLQDLAIKRGMPVTIITGFLGSGKTTLLNHILNNRQDLKVAVLVNEFGDIDIDTQLLVSIDKDMVQLSNGCICCTINEGLVDAVYKILEQKERVDCMVIETTGIADPLPIILTFLGTELRDFTNLDSILTLVDAENFTTDHFESEAALNQIIYSDVILLNKTDLVASEQIDDLENYIHSIKSGARILRCQKGEVPLPLILDVGYNDPNIYTEMLRATGSDQANHKDPHDESGHSASQKGYDRNHESSPLSNHQENDHHHHNHDHKSSHHEHHHSEHLVNDGFVSVSFVGDRPLSLTKFQDFLDNLSTDIFRGKGILWFAESELKHIFQLSGKRFSIDAEEWKTSRSNQIVLIGRNLDAAQIREDIAACQELRKNITSLSSVHF